MGGHEKVVDTQVVELLGQNRLVSELLHAGLEVAIPQRDRGIDLIAYIDLESRVSSFVAKPIQMKASSRQGFAVLKKYAKLRDLILAFVWNLENPDQAITYALSYPEAVAVADRMGWTKTRSWLQDGAYSTSQPSEKLIALLERYKMTSAAWPDRVANTPLPSKSRAGYRD